MNPFIGQIIMFGGNFAPRGWALCNGQLLPIAQNTALFSILGTTYGGDGRTTFGLPSLRGRLAMHAGNGPGLTPRRLGEKSGTETNTLSILNLPSHNHTASGTVSLQGKNGPGDETNPGGGYFATAGTDLYADTPNTNMGSSPVTVTVGNNGANQPVNNLMPYQCVNYIIALVGTFPSRS